MTRAVVFAYSEVGVRCVRELLAQGVEIPLLFTHADDPGESRWFGSVRQLAEAHALRVETPDTPNTPRMDRRRAARAKPDFLFSFYYRHLLEKAWLDVAEPRCAEHARIAAAEVSRQGTRALGHLSTASR